METTTNSVQPEYLWESDRGVIHRPSSWVLLHQAEATT